ncbi:MAG: M48 family metalloprotease [Candidatus Hydrogenedentes bacterium]|nr:M48 family metalloprotease [Candidatus Hydrogenedentota bacterium]
MKTRIPDAVILHVGTDCFVTQQRLTVLNANPHGRILCLGLGFMACIKVDELRSILAHEFAHFTGSDLLYSKIVLRAYMGLETASVSLSQLSDRTNGLARVITAVPFFAIVLLMRVNLLFLRSIDASIHRAREIRADTLATRICGTRVYTDMLKKIHAYGPLFQLSIMRIAGEIQRSRKPDESCLRVWRKNLKSFESSAQEILSDSMVETTNKWADHPALRERIQRLPEVPDQYHNAQPALSLFRELAAYEKLAGEYLANDYRILQREGIHR